MLLWIGNVPKATLSTFCIMQVDMYTRKCMLALQGAYSSPVAAGSTINSDRNTTAKPVVLLLNSAVAAAVATAAAILAQRLLQTLSSKMCSSSNTTTILAVSVTRHSTQE
jgi:hypothetical protein